jgi:hypothetical protein
MPTLWEIWTGQEEKPEPLEMNFYNPYRVRVGNVFTLDTLDHSELSFRLRNLRQIKRRIGGQSFVHGDYNLLATPHGGEPVNVMLRMIPKENSSDHNVVLLTPNATYGVGMPDTEGYNQYLREQDELDVGERDNPQATQQDFIFQQEHIDWFYNEALTKLEFYDTDADGNEVTYYRVNDVQEPWEAEIAIVEDDDGDGTVEEHEIDYHNIRYWDFWTEFEEDGVKVTEWLIVEDDNGYITFWKGRAIDPNRITVD